MIEVSMYFLLGSVIILPSTTFLLSRAYYYRTINHYQKKLWITENTDNNVDVNKLINEMETKERNFKEKQKIISAFLESKSKFGDKTVKQSKVIGEMKNKFLINNY